MIIEASHDFVWQLQWLCQMLVLLLLNHQLEREFFHIHETYNHILILDTLIIHLNEGNEKGTKKEENGNLGKRKTTHEEWPKVNNFI